MGLLDRAGARLTARPEDAEILVVNTCSFIDTAKQESVDTILEMARHKTAGSAKKLIVAGCLVERYRDEIRKNIPEVDAVVGTGELESILEAAGLAPVAAAPSLFNIFSGQWPRGDTGGAGIAGRDAQSRPTAFRPEGDLREQQGRFSRDEWQGASTCCRPISTTKRRRAFSLRPNHRPISRSPKAATTRAASASFPTCAASSARAASSR